MDAVGPDLRSDILGKVPRRNYRIALVNYGSRRHPNPRNNRDDNDSDGNPSDNRQNTGFNGHDESAADESEGTQDNDEGGWTRVLRRTTRKPKRA